MSATQSSIKILRAASLRPVSSRFPASRAFIRQQSTTPPGGGNQGKTEKMFEKDGTNPNKNLIYAGLGVLGLGGLYMFYTGRAEEAVHKTEDKINEKTRR